MPYKKTTFEKKSKKGEETFKKRQIFNLFVIFSSIQYIHLYVLIVLNAHPYHIS